MSRWGGATSGGRQGDNDWERAVARFSRAVDRFDDEAGALYERRWREAIEPLVLTLQACRADLQALSPRRRGADDPSFASAARAATLTSYATEAVLVIADARLTGDQSGAERSLQAAGGIVREVRTLVDTILAGS